MRLVCDVFGDVPDAVVGDSLRLRQILLNLIDNAIKFTSDGAVAVRVMVRTHSNDDVRLQFSVSDSGIGIAPERRQEIFDPFTQADVSTTRRYGGTGLGLAIAANLVGLMDGRIWVESELGRGSTFFFSVRLPLSHEPIDEARTAVEPPRLAAPARPLRILLAEDTRSSQQVIAMILRKRGHTVAVADDGRKALDLAGRENFDVILMDVQMPVLDGLQATAAIRQREAKMGLGIGDWRLDKDKRATGADSPTLIPNPQSPIPDLQSPTPSSRVPIVALTAHAYRDDAEQCMAVGMDAFLCKPIKSEELIDLVERLAEPMSRGAGVPPASAAGTAAPQDSTTVFSYLHFLRKRP